MGKSPRLLRHGFIASAESCQLSGKKMSQWVGCKCNCVFTYSSYPSDFLFFFLELQFQNKLFRTQADFMAMPSFLPLCMTFHPWFFCSFTKWYNSVFSSHHKSNGDRFGALEILSWQCQSIFLTGNHFLPRIMIAGLHECSLTAAQLLFVCHLSGLLKRPNCPNVKHKIR